jgi:hypothetical protein
MVLVRIPVLVLVLAMCGRYKYSDDTNTIVPIQIQTSIYII